MILPKSPAELDEHIKALRDVLLRMGDTQNPLQKAVSAFALSCFPAFLLAVSAELRAGTDPKAINEATGDLTGHMIASVASTMYRQTDHRNACAAVILDTAAKTIIAEFKGEDAAAAAAEPVPPKQEQH